MKRNVQLFSDKIVPMAVSQRNMFLHELERRMSFQINKKMFKMSPVDTKRERHPTSWISHKVFKVLIFYHHRGRSPHWSVAHPSSILSIRNQFQVLVPISILHFLISYTNYMYKAKKAGTWASDPSGFS